MARLYYFSQILIFLSSNLVIKLELEATMRDLKVKTKRNADKLNSKLISVFLLNLSTKLLT